MDGGGGDGGGGGGGGGGGPAPFLLKTYEMVDDPATDDIVSWSANKKSFVVWNALDFAAHLLPTYFKHNNFSSFVRQLNTYGFRKSDPERWEFANDEFVQGRKDLLKNIHRRKPIHSHSHPPGGGLPDAERTPLEEEIDRLNREKTSLESNLWKFKQQQSGTKIQLDDLERRLNDMEQRQIRMVVFMQRAIHNPRFMESLLKMTTASSMDYSMMQKKRRFPPGADYCQEASENGYYDDHDRSSSGHMLDQEFCDKLKLELRSAVLDSNMVTATNQIPNEDTEGNQEKEPSLVMMECLRSVPETLELSDTGASICPTKNFLFPAKVIEDDTLFPCQLNLTLASSSMQVQRSEYPDETPNSVDQGMANLIELRTDAATMENDLTKVAGKETTAAASSGVKATSSQEAPASSSEAPSVPLGRVNDVFWEQFLTERPGSTEAEEASPALVTNTYREKIQEKENGNIWKSKQVMEHLKL